MDANSTVNMEGGAFSVGAKNFGIYATGPKLGTVNITTDQATHITGIMQIDANLNISGRGGGILEVDGGRLILGGPPGWHHSHYQWHIGIRTNPRVLTKPRNCIRWDSKHKVGIHRQNWSGPIRRNSSNWPSDHRHHAEHERDRRV